MKLCTVFGTLALGCVAFYSNPAMAAQLVEAPEPADLILFNARVVTVNHDFALAQAVAVRNGQIVAVGKDDQLTAYKGPNTQMIDAQQRMVLPGLYDGHVHSYQAAVSELHGPMPSLDSIAAAQDYIRKQAAAQPAGSWIILDGLYPSRLKEGRLPTKEELDAATTNHPVYWNFGRISVVNTKALEVSKITASTPNPADGEVVKEPRHNKPTGLLRNAASLLKLPPAPRPPTPQVERAALKRLYQLYNQQGITSIGEREADPRAIDLFRDLSRSNELTVRINCARPLEMRANIDDCLTALDAMTNAGAGRAPYGPTGAGDDWVRMGPLETAVDGDILMATAYLRMPWGIGPKYQITEPAYRGDLKQDQYLLPEVYTEAAQRGWQLSADCTGDAGLDFLLNCYQKVQFKTDITQRRFVVAGGIFQSPQNWELCRQLGVVADMQPAWLYRDGSSLEKTLGEPRLKYFLPFKSWFDKGLIAGGGSGQLSGLDPLDALNPWNPWLGIWITLKRETEQGSVINEEQRLTREQAIRLYTYNNAWLNFEEEKKGSLEPGKLADLVVVDTDILKCPVDDILNTKVLLTMVGGKIVWGANQLMFTTPQITAAPTPVVPPAAVPAPKPAPADTTPAVADQAYSSGIPTTAVTSDTKTAATEATGEKKAVTDTVSVTTNAAITEASVPTTDPATTTNATVSPDVKAALATALSGAPVTDQKNSPNASVNPGQANPDSGTNLATAAAANAAEAPSGTNAPVVAAKNAAAAVTNQPSGGIFDWSRLLFPVQPVRARDKQ